MRIFTKILIGIAAFSPLAGKAALTENQELGLKDLDRCKALVDAVWQRAIRSNGVSVYLSDTYNTSGRGSSNGVSDVWPYTAVIEAHCSLLEALEAAKDIAPELYEENFDVYAGQLDLLIDNLEWYRGTYNLASYAEKEKPVSPFGVHRGGSRGNARVDGIENVYDDQMWIARELIRAYQLTGREDYLDKAVYLTDYVLEGWDCWRDANGNEMGGITWGPGYNSKHACSNAPIIQPLVWLADIFTPTDETIDFSYRDMDNMVVTETMPRGDHYLDFAKKIYAWQKSKLLNSSGCYADLIGAQHGFINVEDGYRQTVPFGGVDRTQYSYNTGTMIAGAAELYRVTGDDAYLKDMQTTSQASLSQFAKFQRGTGMYLFNTDAKATEGFNSWFNDVLMRSYADAAPYVEIYPRNGLQSFEYYLDYAFDNHLKADFLPIKFVEGWGDETVTKGFHQSAFASEYGVLAKWRLSLDGNDGNAVKPVASGNDDDARVFTLSGLEKGNLSKVKDSLPRDIYIVGNRKAVIGK